MWHRPVHTLWRQLLGLMLIVFSLIASAYYYIELHTVSEALGQRETVVARSSPRPSVGPSFLSSAALLTLTKAGSPSPSPPKSKKSGTASTKSGKKTLPSGKINLATATQQQLMTLPHIGAKTAQLILAYRQVHGFHTLDELKKIKGIGPKLFETLRPYLEL